jgi:hypothetical protein
MKSSVGRDALDLKWFSELALMLGGLLFADTFLPFAGISPSPFWVPVLLLTAQYGTMSGLIAAAGASAASLIVERDSTQAGEDYYSIFLLFWRDPIWWFGTALVLGAIIDKRVRDRDMLMTKLRHADEQRRSIADYCERLLSYAKRLEQLIAFSDGRSVEEGLIALGELHESTFEESSSALVRAVGALLGPGARFSILVRQEGTLVRGQLDAAGGGLELPSGTRPATPDEQAFFERMVLCRRVVSTVRDSDAQLLDGIAMAAGPIIEDGQRVIGLLVIEHAAQPMTAAGEVAVRVICAELSHIADAVPMTRYATAAARSRKALRVVS